MPLQIVLDSLDLTGGGRTESPVLVAINQELVLNVQNHIRVVVAVDIHERERDWDQIRAGIIELWPNVDNIYMENIDNLLRGSIYSRKYC